MTECNAKSFLLSSLKPQKVVADFNGGHLTSDVGGLLLREVDHKLSLTCKLAACIPDPRKEVLFEGLSSPLQRADRRECHGRCPATPTLV
jgi:hypothetical protein